ncbi:TIGR02680 family protein [Kitasatospora sp. YST-16]|uniref:TIGR02680 family protein n=1 Tax=Kitasatospora sp. YST-16 TaxID=2998080 RepID=UPI0022833160|nr:TIGR02680 family protein [Kitasatospora sp. YST-16]WAL70687.1 TIGR02680 family protein [Kitasatospora sp. YST-16]WNW36730.1 TIGR02680 family protein [Streptomyces sp. Li-HN-5-13]
MSTSVETPLPLPGRARWQPLRVGLVDLFYYDVEEFHFRDGRLLLRGNNGTGKSKVLALTLPFLLDGDLSPHRVEPDADPKKRMEWNLLLGGEHPYPERLGYTWIEFGRLDEDGTPRYTTLGCGLKAVSGRGIARHWFFVTDRRVGPELRLLDSTGAAIGHDRLAEALDGRGLLYDSARAYRRAVDEALFGLGEQRYAALVDLLVQLRQPQLSKRPSEKALSRALTESLPPVDQAVVADVAEAFRSLDEEKEQLAAMVAAEGAAAAFLQHYRRYARVAARRKARAPRVQHARYETQRAELNTAEQDFEAAGTALAEAEARLVELERRRAGLQARNEVLRAGPEMRGAHELEQAADSAARTAGAAELAEADRLRAEGELARFAARFGAARSRAEAAERALATAVGAAREEAAAAGIGREHADRVSGPLAAGDTPEAAQRGAVEAVDRRLRSVDLTVRKLAAVRSAALELGAARRHLAETDGELAHRAELRAESEEGAGQAGRDYLTAVGTHFADCTLIRPSDPEGMLDELAHWVGSLTGADPARAAAQRAAEAVGIELARRRARLESEREAANERRAALRAESAELLAGRRSGPRAPYTRAPEARQEQDGAPLWRLVDFADDPAGGLTERQKSFLESALEVSGLLDAWVSTDGRVAAAGTWDTLATAGAPVAGRSLATVLRPAVDREDPAAAALPDELVAGLLAGIGLLDPGEELPGEGSWIALDGRFRLGALTGSWSKPAAEYLGERAREQARRTRLAAVESELAEIADRLAALETDFTLLAADLGTLGAEQAAMPDDSTLRGAHATVSAAQREYVRAAERREAADRAVAGATAAAERAGDELNSLAEELSLPVTDEELREVRDALGRYREALAGLWPAVRESRAALAALAAEEGERTRAAERAAELAERSRTAAREAVVAGERHQTLAATVGAAVAELKRQLTWVATALAACEEEDRAARGDQTSAIRTQAATDALRTRVREEIEETSRTRAEAIDALRRFAATGLLSVALPELDADAGSWAPEPAVRLARSVERELESVDDSDPVWERVQRRIMEEHKDLSDALSLHGHTATARLLDDGLVVDVVFQGRERSVPELADALTVEVADRQHLLSAREQEILENHLITEVAGTLQELVGAAEQQVLRMNRELEERPTSTGMLLRLVWRPARNAPGGLAAARQRLLRQSSDAWTDADRTALGEFLQSQIDRARTDSPSGTWLEHLTTALDYRSWHEFGIERHQHGKWQSATGPASGGERVLSVSLPLFAAASSHYASAGNPHAPRLVTLDEAFAGVDDDSRAKSLGLLAAFDLDVVMTSEREWGCYPQVPGLAVAQLSRVDEIAAVLVTRWEWDGRRRTQVPDPAAPAGPASETLFA